MSRHAPFDLIVQLVAEVAPVAPIHRTYSFAVLPEMEPAISAGQRVMIPLGRSGRLVQGFVVLLTRRVWDSTLRPIRSVVDQVSFLTPELIELGKEIARHYACPLGRALKAITPEAVRRLRGFKTVRYARLLRTPEQIRASGARLTAKRTALINALSEAEAAVPVAGLLAASGASAAILTALVKAGWVEIVARKEMTQTAREPIQRSEPTFDLTAEQQNALDETNAAIDAGRFSVMLLHGVSGSGKTEVYIRAMRRVLSQGRQAILLVPEIVLTTQLVQRLSSRFDDVAVIHSGLTGVQRSLMWRGIASGERSVVIGTRSAVFAPCPNLGLLCVDEEQETSYKNLQTPRFHVRDVAIMRAKRLGIAVVLGSATPSVETWFNGTNRRDYRVATLRQRVNKKPLPKVHIVDMRDEFAELKRPVVLSRTMERLLKETLDRGEQAMLLMNRRGFADRVYCPKCRGSLRCPQCNVCLVVHRATGECVCHYCNARTPIPIVCPIVTCGETLVQLGVGTQRVEEVLAQRFPEARVERVDSDTMKHRSHYQRIINEFEARKIDVLVGTQMIAKGLDFPFVSFVGVVSADAAALAGDFRGQERLFQLITQVAGRAGRAETSGRVVVQTTMPELPALQCALRHDYDSFATQELELRRKVGLPPFRRLARIVLSHARDETTRREAEAMVERIREVIARFSQEGTDVLGPSPCTLPRLRGKYRYELLIRTANASSMRALLGELQERKALKIKAVSTIIDVDPVSLT